MLVSCLCVTENRPAFMEWLLWNYRRQSWPERELVIVDSSREPFVSGWTDVRVVRLEPGASHSDQRNAALREARGEIVTWFDDDDWQHPDKIALLAEAMADGALYAGSRCGWFVSLATLWCTRFCNESPIVLLPTMGIRRWVASEFDFVDTDGMASEVAWRWDLHRTYGKRSVVLERDDLSFWLCHGWNLYNTTGRWHFDQRLEALKSVVGRAAWGDTDAALGSLRARIGGMYG